MISLGWTTADHSAFNFCVSQTFQQNIPFYMFRLKFLEKFQIFPQQFSFPQFANKTKAQTPFLHIPEACSRTDCFLLPQYPNHLQSKTHKVFRCGGDASGLATTHPKGFRRMGHFSKTERALTHVIKNIVILLNL